jgi:signal transduction histidine kinase
MHLSKKKQSANNPENKAILLWLHLSAYLTITIPSALYLIPFLYGNEPFISVWFVFPCFFLLYIGMVLGVIKFRLFEIERLSKHLFYWLTGALVVISIDMMVIYLFNITSAYRIGLDLLLAGLVWFPIRQHLLDKILKDKVNPEGYSLTVIESALNSKEPVNQRWRNLLQKVYQPVSSFNNEEANDYKIQNNGLIIDIPSNGLLNSISLEGKSGGRKLFGKSDIDYIKNIQKTFSYIMQLKIEQEQNYQIERERIMRDMHDDILPRLNHIKNKVHDNQLKEHVADVYHELRNTIYLLDNDTSFDFIDYLYTWREEISNQLENSLIHLDWSTDLISRELPLAYRYQVEITRIIKVFITNTLIHSHAKNLQISVKENNATITFVFSDDGNCIDINSISPGMGMKNISSRAKRISATVEWNTNNQLNNSFDSGINMKLVIPINQEQLRESL